MTAADISNLLETHDAISRAQAARIAGVSPGAVRKWTRVGRKRKGQRYILPAARWEGGDMIIILKSDLLTFLQEFPPMLQKRHTREVPD